MDRDAAVQIIEDLRESPGVTVVNLTPELFESAFELYRRHTDKQWGLVDCVSFVVMRNRGLTTALAFDQHFVPGWIPHATCLRGRPGRSDKNLHVSRAYSNQGKRAALREQAKRLGQVRSEVWQRFGSLQGVGLSSYFAARASRSSRSFACSHVSPGRASRSMTARVSCLGFGFSFSFADFCAFFSPNVNTK